MKTGTKSIFISNVRILDPHSSFHNKKCDILIEDGIIKKIGKELKDPFGSERIDGKNLVACPGFADLHVNVQDPGNEHKEEIETALNAAANGGFTGILSCSTTEPSIDNKSAVEYQLRKSADHLVELWVSGDVSKGRHGKELSEMYDMHRAGAKAFYDFKSPLENTQLLKLALLYSKSFGGLIMIHPSEAYLGADASVNEGAMSTMNGLKGMPAIAEELAVERALKLAAYTDQKIHITAVSTIESVELITRARKAGINVTCGVPVSNLLLNENAAADYDSNFKLLPPLRDEKTRKYLVESLAKGTIDVVISDHWPQNVESKECEFELADFGMNTLECTLGMIGAALGDKIDTIKLVEILSARPRRILGIEVPVLDVGAEANITVFNPSQKWKYDVSQSASVSRNNSLHSELVGKAVAVVNRSKIIFAK